MSTVALERRRVASFRKAVFCMRGLREKEEDREILVKFKNKYKIIKKIF
jgi:hypothetical protein